MITNFTLKSFALGDTNDVNHLVLGKDFLDRYFFLEVFASKVNLVGNGASVQLDLDDVGLLLTAPQQLLLGVADQTDDSAVFLHLSKIFLNFLLAKIIFPFEARLCKSLLLGLRPNEDPQ